MAGPRPAHLARRGAVYLARFRLPKDLAARLGMAELRRSLHTSDAKLAKTRCLAATEWFRAEMERLRAMEEPTRADLERAAVEYFRHFAAQADVPGNYDLNDLDYQVGYDIAVHQEVIGLLDDELRSGSFAKTRPAALRLAQRIGVEFDDLPDHLKLAVLQLAARAERELAELQIHRLRTPAKRFPHQDDLFEGSLGGQGLITSISGSGQPSRTTLQSASEDYRAYTAARGVGTSHNDELARVLDWLGQIVGPTTALVQITPDIMKRFRNDLQRIDRRNRGRKLPFKHRLTDDKQHQIIHPTSARYWGYVQAFFAWCAEEQLITASPASIAKIPKPKDLTPRQPPPFTTDELQALMKTPLYAGYRSPKRVNVPGSCCIRQGHWWSGILLMHTGMRAGELAQLLPSDFVFDHEIPHLLVRKTDDHGNIVKSVKTASSVRAVPLHPNLLTLGLREFVAGRMKRYPNGQVLWELRLGTKGRKSEGATRFWLDFLKRNGLWKEGRATHVWRHTVIAFLREAGVSDEDSGPIVGHKQKGQTAAYGQTPMLVRKRATIEKLDFGFNVVEALGGPYDPKVHGKAA